MNASRLPPAIPDRVRWAVDLLEVQPWDRVLEVGGGTGASASLICSLLTDGRLTSLDRSPAAAQRIQRPNQHHVDAGRLEVRQGSLAGFVANSPFDKVLCINVNVFWTTPAKAETLALRRSVTSQGRVVVGYGGAPSAQHDRIARSVTDVLASAGFASVEVRTGEPAFAVVAVVQPAQAR